MRPSIALGGSHYERTTILRCVKKEMWNSDERILSKEDPKPIVLVGFSVASCMTLFVMYTCYFKASLSSKSRSSTNGFPRNAFRSFRI